MNSMTNQYQLADGGSLLHFPHGIPFAPLPRQPLGSTTKYNWLLVGTIDRYNVVEELTLADLEEYTHRPRPPHEHLFHLANGNYLVVQEPLPERKEQDTSASDGLVNIPGGTQGWL